MAASESVSGIFQSGFHLRDFVVDAFSARWIFWPSFFFNSGATFFELFEHVVHFPLRPSIRT